MTLMVPSKVSSDDYRQFHRMSVTKEIPDTDRHEPSLLDWAITSQINDVTEL